MAIRDPLEKKITGLSINLDEDLAVNPLCFLLLEEVEGAFGSTHQHVASFTADGFQGGCIGQPILSVAGGIHLQNFKIFW